jgi:carboxylesterase type B
MAGILSPSTLLLVVCFLVAARLHVSLAANSYLGIRYSLPPPRWQPSTPYFFNSTLLLQRDSSQNVFQNQCLQFGQTFPQGATISEDCHFLNVWLPDNRKLSSNMCDPDCSLPVLVWIYGGGFQSGNARFDIPAFGIDNLVNGGDFADQGDGAKRLARICPCLTCASGGMIVVTFDFRVGAMGYFQPPKNLTLSPGDDVRIPIV